MDVGPQVLIGEEKAAEDGMNPGIDCPRWESDRSSAWCGVLETANYIEYIGFSTTLFHSIYFLQSNVRRFNFPMYLFLV